MKIKINGNYFEHFNDFTLSTNLDSVASTFAFTARFDPANPDHKVIFRPASFLPVQFYHDNGKVFSTGTIVTHSFGSSAVPELVRLSGYSLGGVLEDCQVPYESYSLESNNRSLEQIATRLLNYFKLKLIVYDSVKSECAQNIEKSVAEPTESVKDYISKIAAQKDVIFSHDIYGHLILFRPDINAKSKAFFTKENTLKMGHEVNGQALHSSITTLRQPKREDNISEEKDGFQLTAKETVINPNVLAYRPRVSVLTSGTTTDTAEAAKNLLASELQNIKVGVSLDRWYPDISIGDIVEIQNDEIYFYDRTRMLVQNTTLSESAAGQNLDLVLVLPEAFSTDQSRNIHKRRGVYDHAQHL